MGAINGILMGVYAVVYDDTKKKAHDSKIVRKPQVELRWGQPTTSIRHQPTD